jgi:ABC-type branched-subunit amino acid transport system ATPase component
MSSHKPEAGGAAVVIQTSGLTKRYGGVVAIDGVDLEIGRGEIYGIIGPNGAGKSTLVGLLGGALKPSSGTIHYEGEDITSVAAAARARNGIGRTYQIPRPFLDMTVAENLEVPLFSTRPFLGRGEARDAVAEMLVRTKLGDVAHRAARDLPLLRRKRLEVARALMVRPRLLLLDEVGAGLISSEVDELIALIHELNDGSLSIVIIEHIIRIVRECCRRVAVINTGKKFADGATAEVLESEDVAAIYLGTAHSRSHASTSARASQKVGERDDGGPKQSKPPLLDVEKISAGYGQARVLTDLSFSVAEGEALAVLGANGAGKTTLANALSGAIKITAGRIRFNQSDLTAQPGHMRVRAGIAHCMEGRRIFPVLSVEENLLIAARGASQHEKASRVEEVYSLFPVLGERRGQPGTSLSGGEQQMLAIGRALMGRPKLIIFDEISLGLAPLIMDKLYATLGELRRRGLTMLIVEQDVDRALELSDRAIVLEHGQIALSGTAAEIRSDDRLRQLYLGKAD